jgi:predicted phage baseplate assembly protein
MPLPSPILDDRSYQQLRDELVRRIPVYAPEWTDHNPSDPGITLIELFAFLGENLLYRFNQIPEATKLEYLKLLQIPLRPAVPANAMLALSTEQPKGVLVTQATQALAGNLPFETRTECHAWPVSGLAMARIRTAEPTPRPSRRCTSSRCARWTRCDRCRRTTRPITTRPRLSHRTAAAHRWTSAPPSTACCGWRCWPRRLRSEGAVAGGAQHRPCRTRKFRRASRSRLAQAPTVARAPAVEWQVSLAKASSGQFYKRLQVTQDSTRGLTQEGVVRLRLPKDLAEIGAPQPDDRSRPAPASSRRRSTRRAPRSCCSGCAPTGSTAATSRACSW